MRSEKFLICLFCLLLVAPLGFAAEAPNISSSAHFDSGVHALKENNTNAAIEHFLKSALLDTSNHEAIKNLRLIADDKSKGDLKERLLLQRLTDTVEYIDFLKGRMAFLQKNNAHYIDIITNNSKASPEIRSQLEVLRTNLQKNQSLSAERFNLLSSEEIDRPAEIHPLLAKLSSVREHLLDQVNYLQSMNTQFYNLKSSLAQQIANSAIDQKTRSQSSAISVLREQLTQKENALQKQNQSIAQMDEELKSLRSEFDNVQAQLNENNRKFAYVTQQLTKITMDSYEKEKRLADKNTQLDKALNDLKETTERLNLAQRLIQEKDQKLVDLKHGVSADSAAQATSDSATQKKVEHLEASLGDLDAKYTELSAKLEQKSQQIMDLKLRAVEKDQYLNDLRMAFSRKDQKVTELNGILNLYRWKLMDMSMELKDREKKIEELQKLFNALDQKMGTRLDHELSQPKQNFKISDRPQPLSRNGGIWPNQEILQDLQSELNLKPYRAP